MLTTTVPLLVTLGIASVIAGAAKGRAAIARKFSSRSVYDARHESKGIGSGAKQLKGN